MKVCEIFESIQGEGKYVGQPALFIRVSGCNRNCEWCDSKFHTKGKEMSVDEMVKIIKESKLNHVVWTGGEPTLYEAEIEEIVTCETEGILHMLETNGVIMNNMFLVGFNYICFSPKNREDLDNLLEKINPKLYSHDIKIVTDLEKVGVDMIDKATMLMPFTTFNPEKDKEIQKRVWEYCVENNIKYSPRIHVDVWGKKRGV